MVPAFDVIYRFFIAFILGSIIGLEREWHRRTAGIRTNALVCLGASGFVIFASFFPHDNSPTRVAAQIVSGIGFLGAGVIMREGLTVRGLNSAATIWCSSTVGVFAGGGLIIEACVLTTAIMVTNLLLRQFVQNIGARFLKKNQKNLPTYMISISCLLDHHISVGEEIKKKLDEEKFTIKNFESLTDQDSNTFKLSFTVITVEPKDKILNDIIMYLAFRPDVLSADWLPLYDTEKSEQE